MAEMRKRLVARAGKAEDEVILVAFLVGVVAWRVAPIVINYFRAS